MSAPSCIVFFGLRYEISDREIEGLEDRTDARMVAARDVGLKSYWGNFNPPDELYYLFVGAELGVLGPENQLDAHLSSDQFEAVAANVREKLLRAKLVGHPQLYMQWEADA